jgi:hypothetical protein
LTEQIGDSRIWSAVREIRVTAHRIETRETNLRWSRGCAFSSHPHHVDHPSSPTSCVLRSVLGVRTRSRCSPHTTVHASRGTPTPRLRSRLVRPVDMSRLVAWLMALMTVCALVVTVVSGLPVSMQRDMAESRSNAAHDDLVALQITQTTKIVAEAVAKGEAPPQMIPLTARVRNDQEEEDYFALIDEHHDNLEQGHTHARTRDTAHKRGRPSTHIVRSEYVAHHCIMLYCCFAWCARCPVFPLHHIVSVPRLI